MRPRLALNLELLSSFCIADKTFQSRAVKVLLCHHSKTANLSKLPKPVLKLVDWPYTIVSLIKLKKFDGQKNAFKIFPSILGFLPKLSYLSLRCCMIEKLDFQSGEFPSLASVSFQDNQLTSVKIEKGAWKSIRESYLSKNMLEEMSDLSALGYRKEFAFNGSPFKKKTCGK